MRKHFLYASTLLLAACISSCQGSKSGQGNDDTVTAAEGEFVIVGQLPPMKYDSACLYLVPMQGPHPRPVDSVFVGQDGRFEFRGNVEQMAVLRMTMKQRMGLQDLLVVTEPGVTRVTLDSISSASGTPQNEALQQWKEHIEQTRAEYLDIASLRQQYGNESDAYKEAYETFRKKEGEFYYTMLKGLGRQTASIFIHKMMTGELDSLRRAELDELLKDTTDYTKPQPGFRR